jgi:hypothetical protein
LEPELRIQILIRSRLKKLRLRSTVFFAWTIKYRYVFLKQVFMLIVCKVGTCHDLGSDVKECTADSPTQEAEQVAPCDAVAQPPAVAAAVAAAESCNCRQVPGVRGPTRKK